ncbi:MAG: hypothetical protein GAK32_02127 [Pseudomonas fluorescens]|nr:MAG: hypothetical protein GAK32_02127 [Pseudomonas fluorescens]
MPVKKLCLPLTSLYLLVNANAALAEDWQYSLKAGVGNLPRYSGSDERTTAPLLGGAIKSPGGFFLDTDKGLGWGYDGSGASFSAYVGARRVMVISGVWGDRGGGVSC